MGWFRIRLVLDYSPNQFSSRDMQLTGYVLTNVMCNIMLTGMCEYSKDPFFTHFSVFNKENNNNNNNKKIPQKFKI